MGAHTLVKHPFNGLMLKMLIVLFLNTAYN